MRTAGIGATSETDGSPAPLRATTPYCAGLTTAGSQRQRRPIRHRQQRNRRFPCLVPLRPPGRPGLQDQARGDHTLNSGWPWSPYRSGLDAHWSASTIPGFGGDQARSCPSLHGRMPLHRSAPVEQRSISRRSGWFEPEKGFGGDAKLFRGSRKRADITSPRLGLAGRRR